MLKYKNRMVTLKKVKVKNEFNRHRRHKDVDGPAGRGQDAER